MRLASGLALCVALALGGCDFAPDFQLPHVALPATFKEAQPDGGVVSLAWWRAFNDRRLDELESMVEGANPSLAAAAADNDIAQSRAKVALAGLFPEVDAAGHVSDNKQSAHRPLRSANQPTYYGDNALDAQTSYELDIWGRVHDLVKAADYTAQASVDALAEARLELHAELARAYVDLRGIDDETRLLASTVKLYQSALDLTQTRLKAEIAPPIDVQRATTQLNATQAQLADLNLRRATLEDAIAALVGRPAASYRLPPAPGAAFLPRRPRVVPAEVLTRRPDVAQAARIAAAASEDIGAAKAALYPRFTLNLLFGTQDTSLRLLDPANTFGTIGPAVSYPLFDGGLRKAELDIAKSAFTEAAEIYRARVLEAVKEVQDNVEALHWLADESTHTSAAAESARKAAEMSMTLYKDGAASFLDVYTAESAALDAQRLAIALHTRELEASIGLMLALGGGWTPSVPAPVAPVPLSSMVPAIAASGL